MIWSGVSEGSQPMSRALGAKPVVEFLVLLCMAVAMGSHLDHWSW
jgi:hypothetical protein